MCHFINKITIFNRVAQDALWNYFYNKLLDRNKYYSLSNWFLLHHTLRHQSTASAQRLSNRSLTGKPWRPSKPYRPSKKPYVPLKPTQETIITNDFDDDGDKSKPEYAVGFNIQHSKPDTTIIRNIGEDYFGIPPGVSVRAHVQSIDLYPFGSKPISPSEALENDET